MGLRRTPTGVPDNRAQCNMSPPAIISWILYLALQSEMPLVRRDLRGWGSAVINKSLHNQ